MKRFLLASLCTLLLANTSFAEIEIKKFSEAIPVTVETAIDTKSTQANTPFVLTLADTVKYQNLILPVGTQLSGNIQTIRQSKRWGRPARYNVLFDQINIPQQGAFNLADTLASEKKDSRDVRFKPFSRLTAGQQFKRQLLTNLISAAITLPLVLTTDISGWEYLFIDSGVDGVVGAGVEMGFADQLDERSRLEQGTVGFLRGASPPGVGLITSLVQKSPDIVYTQGQQTETRLPKSFWLSLQQQLSPQLAGN